MTNKNNEATLVGYKLLFDTKGNLVTERLSTDIEKLKKSLSKEDYSLLKTIISETQTKLDKIHIEIENSLDSRK